MAEDNMKKAIFYMVISSLGFAFMQAFLKMAEVLPYFEKVFFRNFISMIVAFMIIRKEKVSLFGEKKNRKYLFWRSVFGLAGVTLYFYSVSYLTMADAAMLNKVSPFFVTLIAAFVLKEKIDKFQIQSLLLAFLGVILITKPEFSMTFIPSLAGFLAAAFAGASYVMVRFLKDKEDPSTIVFFFSLFSSVVLLPPTIATYSSPTPVQWLYLLGIGVTALIGQYYLTLAYKYAPASEISICSYLMVIFSAVIGYALWYEIPDLRSIIGCAIIIFASTMIYIKESHITKKMIKSLNIRMLRLIRIFNREH